MTVLIFVAVLVALIVVHELGHFFVAKAVGMKVEEFGIGYPPRIASRKFGETEYSVNALPFGGFVRIKGEDGTEDERRDARSFSAKSYGAQAATLVAGIAMNLLFAWFLISLALLLGVPRVLSPEEAPRAADAALTVAQVLPESPAAAAGVQEGDVIVRAAAGAASFDATDADAFTAFVAAHPEALSLDILRDGAPLSLSAMPSTGVVEADPARAALGVSIAVVGTVRESLWSAFADGTRLTAEITKEVAVGLAGFFMSVATLSADLSQVTGPVGIAGAVGTAAHTGFASLLSLTAIISINLALINLLPVPALDGGRLLFVLIESFIRRPIRPVVANAVNAAGFAFLLFLMLVVTAHDIFRIVG